ncbi:MAG: exopolyphosphatase [Anaerotignum sp.]
MRLLTRSDFDGLACGTMLIELGLVDEWKFVHPKDVQDGLIEVTDNDIMANIPYLKGCKMWFDHHSSESERLGDDQQFEGESRLAPSAARIIYEYYGGKERLGHFEELVVACDKVDSGNLTKDEILNPTDWILLGFIMDPRTGLGRFRDFRIPNYKLMEELMQQCRTDKIDTILKNPDVAERIELYFEQQQKFIDMVQRHTKIYDNLIVSDLRNVETIYTGNRFLIYSLYPEQNISLWIVDGRDKLNVAIACGYSILNRTSNTNVGSLMLKYGGGGHKQVGTCQVDTPIADQSIAEIIEQIRIDG